MGKKRPPLSIIHDDDRCRGEVAISHVGLNDQEELTFDGICTVCSALIAYKMTWAEFKRTCGPVSKAAPALPAPSVEPEYVPGEFTSKDVSFLSNTFKICLPDSSPQEAKP